MKSRVTAAPWSILVNQSQLCDKIPRNFFISFSQHCGSWLRVQSKELGVNGLGVEVFSGTHYIYCQNNNTTTLQQHHDFARSIPPLELFAKHLQQPWVGQGSMPLQRRQKLLNENKLAHHTNEHDSERQNQPLLVASDFLTTNLSPRKPRSTPQTLLLALQSTMRLHFHALRQGQPQAHHCCQGSHHLQAMASTTQTWVKKKTRSKDHFL